MDAEFILKPDVLNSDLRFSYRSFRDWLQLIQKKRSVSKRKFSQMRWQEQISAKYGTASLITDQIAVREWPVMGLTTNASVKFRSMNALRSE